ncbi:MAG: DNA polymerase III subunit delta [Candidatus Nealsonbacteria bacterium RIFCSPLOWO2_02_39_8]|uniref:DNA-directed DNA polymerase n=1 Tax=Candidatus Nealsonbacteria bacterium RIFCSPLOWO2_02_39_8 TaxID=1801674 RepID=A0A1G2EJT1_9BACT|nr:MAG: DNA polymerase III subunit delta [Candidatus Nealsonbacteria bacterium RIFCSPHIGHO2_02_38_10]OGZ22272.1 MAG: DNA polymerase III subunit delta [Candidatus Nealsonbacteria bacterium RIFCSPHIGHO2_02_FULL_38_75]OGZ22459.1 MAG: DNA polymerase III subunit delta [Candidatus Nealsonbacteria bacterium RIFCSPHIGHO2_12_FULL_38_18]OGZ26044.1 MAG: DNA polymerase III subunit delta [Candidatus Nealsonbacteria bacterium RIFCSPLOWO2_02_39_8]OGZ26531.1 MAG: DNA polymerase III subunit delta [Candidatus Ne
MFIFIYGQDTYRMKGKLSEIIEEYKKSRKSGLSLKFIDCQKTGIGSFGDFQNDSSQFSMFKEKKLIVVTDPFSDIDFKEKFLKNKENFTKLDDLVVFYQEGEVRKNDSLFKFLEKNALCQNFNLLEGQKLKKWVSDEFEKSGARFGEDAADELCFRVGSDLWRMANEIKKITAFGLGKEIKREDVAVLVRPKIESDIFKTIDAVANGEKQTALQFIRKHIEKGDSPVYLFSMVNYQFRNLLVIKDFIEKRKTYDVISRASGLHPFVVKKGYYLSYKFTLSGLKKIYQRIFQIDLEIKTGRIEPEAALEMLIAEI